jgi:hypothetical protein
MLRGLASATTIEEVRAAAAGPTVDGDVVWWGTGRQRTGLVGRGTGTESEEARTMEESGGRRGRTERRDHPPPPPIIT